MTLKNNPTTCIHEYSKLHSKLADHLCTQVLTSIYCCNPSLFFPGYRTSVASSTDTGDEHDTDIEDPTPLPPPRPRHWAKRAKEQSMAPESNSGKLTEEQSKADDPSSPSDWSKSVPQFPLPTFKPTIQSKSLTHIQNCEFTSKFLKWKWHLYELFCMNYMYFCVTVSSEY